MKKQHFNLYNKSPTIHKIATRRLVSDLRAFHLHAERISHGPRTRLASLRNTLRKHIKQSADYQTIASKGI